MKYTQNIIISSLFVANRAQIDQEKAFTLMKVRVEGQSAVLYVEGKGVDVEVTGADHPQRLGIVHLAVVVQVQVGDLGSCVFIHAAGSGG